MRSRLILSTAFLIFAAAALPAQIRIVNMIPASMSDETRADGEPNIAVDPKDPQRIAGSAFTPDPDGGANAPIFISIDGGVSWAVNRIVPGADATYPTGDITLRFGGTSGYLYVGTLRGDSFLRLNIGRTSDFTSSTVLETLVDRTNVDQPYVQAATVMGGTGTGNDQVFVGNNDFAAGTQTATVDHAGNGTMVSPVTINARRLETRTTASQDFPPIRPAIHADGTVYAIFYRWTGGSYTNDVVVVRDDTWAGGATTFDDLTDPSDGLAGRLVVTGVNVPFENFHHSDFGQERFVGSHLSIAVDPRDSNTVTIAYAEKTSGSDYTLHVRRSTNRGVDWSTDLLTVAKGINPALAINTRGRIGFMYQQLTGATGSHRWQTHLRRTDDGTTWSDVLLADTDAAAPGPDPGYGTYLGDYIHLMAVGKDFYGIFTASNLPNSANFLAGAVTYQRYVSWGTQQLFEDAAMTTTVPISLDPFFVHVEEAPPSQDFYVRDWNTATAGDDGDEPSIMSWFWHAPDVWNRRGSSSGEPFATEVPESFDAGNGAGNIGDNWAFARIRRKAAEPGGPDRVVTAHFLVSKFGVGNPYVDATMADPDLTFPDPDPTVTFTAADAGPFTTSPYHWHLNAIASTHLCLAVEITTPGDEYVPPTLRGNAPGWPFTDLRIINDNNKAQRNMGLSTTPATGSVSGIVRGVYYGMIHNAATFERDVVLKADASSESFRQLGDPQIEIAGGERKPLRIGDTIVFPRMQPAESRWMAVSYVPTGGEKGEISSLDFTELKDGVAVNGFSIGAKWASIEEVISANAELTRSVAMRLDAGFGMKALRAVEKAARQLAHTDRVTAQQYTAFVRRTIPVFVAAVRQLELKRGSGGAFGLDEAVRSFEAAMPFARRGDVASLSVAHSAYLNRLDSYLTKLQVENGDLADILLTVRLQSDIFRRNPRLAKLPCARDIIGASDSFITRYGARKISERDYPQLVAESKCLAMAAQELDVHADVAALYESRDLAALQGKHRKVLLALDR